MEVHHHAHPEVSGHRKKWTHYFWEFLMLFLAVIAGFYAENIREHAVEHRRGKEYLKSFLTDLKTDTANYKELLETYDKKVKVLSHNYDCYLIIKNGGDFNPCLSEILAQSFGFPDLIPEDRTLQQLKNSGALRLIPKQDADSITIYDSELREQLQGERTGVQEVQTLLRNTWFELLNYDVFYKRFIQHNDSAFISGTFLINNKDLSKIDRLFAIIAQYQMYMDVQYQSIFYLNERAKSLINYFSKKYHF